MKASPTHGCTILLFYHQATCNLSDSHAFPMVKLVTKCERSLASSPSLHSNAAAECYFLKQTTLPFRYFNTFSRMWSDLNQDLIMAPPPHRQTVSLRLFTALSQREKDVYMLNQVLDLCPHYTRGRATANAHSRQRQRALPDASGPMVSSLPLRSPPELSKAPSFPFLL